MKAVWRVLGLIVQKQRWLFALGALLSVVVLLSGIALLGVSGWFITAAAAAGIAGVGAVFDVFRPSASIRFLAIGRTAGRYGERLITHDATMRALAGLRVTLLERLVRAPFDRMARLRGAQALNRLMADVDALDAIPLRLVLPVGAGLITLTVAFAGLWWMTGFFGALWVAGIYAALGFVLLIFVARTAFDASRRAERASQAIRSRFIDLIRARNDLAVFGLLEQQAGKVLDADQRARNERRKVFGKERLTGVLLGTGSAIVVGGAMLIGDASIGSGQLTAPMAAILVFAGLALVEVVMPLRRAVAEMGRMADAARRVDWSLSAPDDQTSGKATGVGEEKPVALQLDGITFRHGAAHLPVVEDFSLSVGLGERLALIGPSGRGKSTLLLIMARLLNPERGTVRLLGADISMMAEPDFRNHVTLLLQRSALMAGSVREALAISKPDLTDDEAWRLLDAVGLAETIRNRGGLDYQIGESGHRLSGGEGRRLALARALLRNPDILLLDEVTEGLDPDTAKKVLSGIDDMCPDATIIVAAHRQIERDWALREITVE
ncbi:MAG: thiol reductant ABC exporter subunit CydC [Hyphomicrobiaceae bacterium]|nr:thiol reductant ABC exporter subunit CydC [Hyphomicrobiaceae bacterium]MCC0023406.1 thiol reductant ABC exporter subunit CydC [Hyphomicrobiaceae bacterium]